MTPRIQISKEDVDIAASALVCLGVTSRKEEKNGRGGKSDPIDGLVKPEVQHIVLVHDSRGHLSDDTLNRQNFERVSGQGFNTRNFDPRNRDTSTASYDESAHHEACYRGVDLHPSGMDGVPSCFFPPLESIRSLIPGTPRPCSQTLGGVKEKETPRNEIKNGGVGSPWDNSHQAVLRKDIHAPLTQDAKRRRLRARSRMLHMKARRRQMPPRAQIPSEGAGEASAGPTPAESCEGGQREPATEKRKRADSDSGGSSCTHGGSNAGGEGGHGVSDRSVKYKCRQEAARMRKRTKGRFVQEKAPAFVSVTELMALRRAERMQLEQAHPVPAYGVVT
ncbi:unnamed protein product [Discosporangium mesarthrocarpum]